SANIKKSAGFYSRSRRFNFLAIKKMRHLTSRLFKGRGFRVVKAKKGTPPGEAEELGAAG
ncbi:MAG: hypothetical protein U0M50_07370, partial [Paramuribaculum sp.]